MSPARRTTRAGARAFTLLEVILAAMIGMMAVLACIGMFAAVDGQTVLGRERFDESLQLERTHETVARSMQLLLMSDSPMPVAPPGEDGRTPPPQGDAARNPDDPPPPEPPPSEAPRLNLSFDRALDIPMIDREGKRFRPQRLELALRTPPIFVADDAADLAEPERLSRRERREERERREADREALLDLEENDVAVAPGLRGVFELSFEPGPSPVGGMDGTFSLWWRQLGVAADRGADPEEGAYDPGDPGAGRALLLSNLTLCHWRVYAKDEEHDEITATWADQLPAYVFLDVETAMGTFHSWLFEVAWSTGKEPGAQTRTPIEQSEPADGQRRDRAQETGSGTEGATPVDSGPGRQRSPSRPSRPSRPGPGSDKPASQSPPARPAPPAPRSPSGPAGPLKKGTRP